MELIYEFDPSQRIVNTRFEGLDGTESVTSVKDALCLLKIRNPAVKFAETVQSGGYNDTSDAEYERKAANQFTQSVFFGGSVTNTATA